jgi:hypothetical protein
MTFLPEERTLALEEFKYALESWRQTPAFTGFSSAQLFHCNALRRVLSWLVQNIFVYEHPEGSESSAIKLQECAVISIYFFVRAARALLRPSSLNLGNVGIFDSKDRRIFSKLS